MDFQNTDLRGGSLQISTEVIGKIARCAALEIDGVAEVSCGGQNKKLKDLLEASSIQSPVVVEMRDGTANITLNLMMSFGARIPAVAEKVQENVKNAVQNMTNVTVSRVNLVIAGLAQTTAAEKENKIQNWKPILSVLWPERLRAARGTLWKIFCPVEKHARMHFCWHFRRPLVISRWQRPLPAMKKTMKSTLWMVSASIC